MNKQLLTKEVCGRHGVVCLDVLDDQNWIPDYNIILIFYHYLPTLLWKPNAEDPMNSDDAVHFFNDTAYEAKVKEHTQKYAKPEDARVVADVGSSAGSGNKVQAVGPGDESRAAGSVNEAAVFVDSSTDFPLCCVIIDDNSESEEESEEEEEAIRFPNHNEVTKEVNETKKEEKPVTANKKKSPSHVTFT
ncbi:ubiquitin-conjugating enzyme E2 4, partial [Tanacetum coccineum]